MAGDSLFLLILPLLLFAAALILSQSVLRVVQLPRWERFVLAWHIHCAGVFVFLLAPHLGQSLSAKGLISNDGNYLLLWWYEFGRFDQRWLLSDPLISVLEIWCLAILTPGAVLGVWLILQRRPTRLLLAVGLSLCQLFGMWIILATEWLEGAPNLNPRALYWIHYLLWFLADLLVLYLSGGALLSILNRRITQNTA